MQRVLLAGLVGLLASVFAVEPARADGFQGRKPGWTGLYVGLHAGWIDGASSGAHDTFQLFQIDPTAQSLDGNVVGGQIGYNYQLGQIVLGAEISGSWADADGAGNCFVNFPSNPFNNCRIEQEWSAMFLSRLGLAFNDRILAYALGGVAMAHVEQKFNYLFPIFLNPAEQKGSADHIGVVFGDGLQFAIGDNLSFGVEWLHTNYGSQTYHLQTTQGAVATIATHQQDLETDVVRAVLNYRFGPPP
jgi:outer membrane immunogenic protein